MLVYDFNPKPRYQVNNVESSDDPSWFEICDTEQPHINGIGLPIARVINDFKLIHNILVGLNYPLLIGLEIMNRYKVETYVCGAHTFYGPQILRPSSSESLEETWLPLNSDGYLLDPESWDSGRVRTHLLLPTFDEATEVLHRAMDINEDPHVSIV